MLNVNNSLYGIAFYSTIAFLGRHVFHICHSKHYLHTHTHTHTRTHIACTHLHTLSRISEVENGSDSDDYWRGDGCCKPPISRLHNVLHSEQCVSSVRHA